MSKRLAPENIRRRRAYSKKRIEALSAEISKSVEARSLGDLCIYVTGSYGRLEASKRSDLDIFFIHAGKEGANPVSNISKILLDAHLIKLARRKRFPDFSADGKYLEIHYIDDLIANIGSREDDYLNFFTARLLLLLESKPIRNELAYKRYVSQIVRSYFRDFERHTTTFRPRFLINDITRYWRTLCLNYEQRRKDEEEDRVLNFKLKFSRMLTCFSTIIRLAAMSPPITERAVLGVIEETPVERLLAVAARDSKAEATVARVLSEYDWFLERTRGGNQATKNYLGRTEAREQAFERADRFGDLLYELLSNNTEPDTIRYLVI